MCAYRVKAGETKGPGRVAAAILAVTLLGLILVGFTAPGRAGEDVTPVVFTNDCPVGVWEGSSFQVELGADGSWSRIGFYLVFESITAGVSDYTPQNGVYQTSNPGRLTFQTISDDLAEGDETFQLKVGTSPSQIGASAEQRCAVTILDDDMMQVGPPPIHPVGSMQGPTRW